MRSLLPAEASTPSAHCLGGKPLFPETRWSLVARAESDEEAMAEVAVADLCRAYWYPVYAYIRWLGVRREDAEDLTQSFFARFLRQEGFRNRRPELGKLRTLLCLAAKRSVVDFWRRGRAKKRASGGPLDSPALEKANARFEEEVSDRDTPESLYERRWAEALLDTVMAKLEADYHSRNLGRVFDVLRHSIPWNVRQIPYHELMSQLKLSRSGVGMALLRLRKRYETLLRTEIAATLSKTDDVETELRYLRSLFQRT